ncbi:cytochrome P450 4C1-like isoform X1 [Schistocerca gregaria]|uniref:cytochrome P450 4C1-like isoform X1 n=1 Tax=Schistocerca gregaria TaxID=7010 RepID=UPI00211DE644|nr:cytochrome P450 4C1-like isoform X1 [Schistocerca gregaria]XP_049834601.1 cytochrome P450 4C1-like isoform X1 [Schistocerca gregaria]
MTSQQVQWAGWPVLVVLAALFWPLWRWWWGRQRLRQLAARIPGPEPWPLVGNAPLFCRNPQRAFQTVLALIDHYGPTVRVWIGSKLYIVVTDPQDIACVLGNSSVISRDSYINRLASNLMGQSLITASGELWKAHRKIVAPAFSSNVLQDMVPELSRQAEQLSATLADLADGATLDVFPYVAAAVLEAVCRTTMGAAPAAAGERRYVQLLARSVAIVEEKFCKPWLWACGWLYRRTALYRDEARTLAELNAFSQEVIAQRSCRRQEAAGGDSRDKQVVLDYLLAATESGGRLSATELQDEVNTLLSAGYETTATTICFALLLLGMYPRVQDNLVAELDAVFGDDPQRTPTAADLRRLHYLDAVIKETLRLFPPAPIIHREVETSELKIGGCTLPVGASVLVLSYSAHRHPDHFDSPQHFCPERFAEPRARPRHPYAYVPFGAGPRICVGRAYGLLLAKAAVAAVLRRLRVESRLSWQDLRGLAHGIVLKLEAGFPLELFPRYPAHYRPETPAPPLCGLLHRRLSTAHVSATIPQEEEPEYDETAPRRASYNW